MPHDSALQKRERRYILNLLVFGGLTHWIWFFFFQHFFPEINDNLWTRLVCCSAALLAAIYIYLDTMLDHKIMHRIILLVVWLYLINEAFLLYLNYSIPIFYITFLGIGIIASCTVIVLKDFFGYAIFTVFVPLVFSWIGETDPGFPLQIWSVFIPFIFIFLGYLVYSNFVYRKNLENAYIQAARNSKLASLGEMAGGIAHEINNPLAIIRGKTDLLLSKCESSDNSTPKAELFKVELQKIKATSIRIENTISSLLSLSRNSKIETLVAVNLQTVISQIRQICHERMLSEGIDFRLKPYPESLVAGHEGELAQVLMNLIQNSVDAVAKLPEKWIEIRLEQNNDYINLVVTDSGPIISADVREHMMDPFYTTKEAGKGTGLGLSISRSIMSSIGGELFYLKDGHRNSFVMKCKAFKTLV